MADQTTTETQETQESQETQETQKTGLMDKTTQSEAEETQETQETQETKETQEVSLPDWIKESFDGEIPEEIANNKNLEGFKNPADAVKSYAELQKKFSETRPQSAPENPDDYSYKPNEEMDLTFAEDQLKQIKQDFHEKGFSDEQMKNAMSLYEKYAVQGKEQMESLRAEREKISETELRESWGKNFKENLQEARNTMDKLWFTDLIKENGLDADHQVWKKFHQLSQVLSEDTVSGKPENFTYQEQIEKLNSKLRTMQPTNPNYDRLQKQREALYSRAYPG